MDMDPEELGRGIGKVIREAIAPLARRVAELELLVKGINADDVDRHAKSFTGEDDLDG